LTALNSRVGKGGSRCNSSDAVIDGWTFSFMRRGTGTLGKLARYNFLVAPLQLGLAQATVIR
jgi:hypothetical protein